MNNFISILEELNKLYEEAAKEEAAKADKKIIKPEDTKEESCSRKSITEAADDEEIEIVDDEEVSDEVEGSVEDVEEDEPKQVLLECSKCGALVVKSEVDVVVDEGTDLVDVDETCSICGESGSYKIVGVVVPYEIEDGEPEDESEVEPEVEPEDVEIPTEE